MAIERLRHRLDRLRLARPSFEQAHAAEQRHAARLDHLINRTMGNSIDYFLRLDDVCRVSDRHERLAHAGQLLAGDSPALWMRDQLLLTLWLGGRAKARESWSWGYGPTQMLRHWQAMMYAEYKRKDPDHRRVTRAEIELLAADHGVADKQAERRPI